MDEVKEERMKMQGTGMSQAGKTPKDSGDAKRKRKRNTQSLKTTAVFKTPGREDTYANKIALKPVATNDIVYLKNYGSVLPKEKVAVFTLHDSTEPKDKVFRVPGCLELIPEGEECSIQTRLIAKKLKRAGLTNGFGSVRLNPILQMSLKAGSKGEDNASKHLTII
jgi:hypothetical protein